MTNNFGAGTTGSSSGTSTGIKYNTPATVVSSQLNDGDRFILIKQSRQSDQPQVWSSGDSQETQQMFRTLQSAGVVDTLQSAG
jgi:hypothetical protein